MIRVSNRKRLNLSPLISEVDVRFIGEQMVVDWRRRIAAARNTMDQPAKPLKKGYAIFKANWVKNKKSFTYTKWWTKAYTSGKARKGNTVTLQNQRKGIGIRAVRDLYLTGEMLDNFQIRKATKDQLVAAFTTRAARQKAAANERIEEFVAFSGTNIARVVNVARGRIEANIPKMVQAA